MQKYVKYWSFVGTLVLVTLIVNHYGAFTEGYSDLRLFITGEGKSIAKSNEPIAMRLPYFMGMAVVSLLVSLVLMILQAVILGKTRGKHILDILFGILPKGNYLGAFFEMTALEEAFARLIFLGLLTKISFLSGKFGLYFLFLVGNSLWSLIHLKNYISRYDKNPLRVLPQFSKGIIYSVVYLKCGFVGALMTHFIDNAILFSLAKAQKVGKRNFVDIFNTIILTAISYFVLSKPLTDVISWLGNNPTFPLPGWGLWDYVMLSIFVPCVITLVLNLLFYDHSPETAEKIVKQKGVIVSNLFFAFYSFVYLMFVFAFFWLAGIFVASVTYRILIVVILLFYFTHQISLNGTSRTFWTHLITNFVIICCLQALNWENRIIFIIIHTLIILITTIIINKIFRIEPEEEYN